jgi:membrane fusion protein, multidrug efflux system
MAFVGGSTRPGTLTTWRTLLASSMAALVAGCQPNTETAAPPIRPVRTVTIERRDASAPVTLTGSVRAQDEAALAFRVSGRMTERRVNLGERVERGQPVARLDPQNERNALHAAEANLAGAQGQLTNARANLSRQQALVNKGFVAVAELDRAREVFETAKAQVDTAQANRKFAEDQVGFTELKADADGVVTAIGAEPGEVVPAGAMVVRLARQEGRDAVFDVPAQVIRSAPGNPEVTVSLADDPDVQAVGHVREVAPQADPVTRTFEVKVGLTDPPPTMRLGATVIGRMAIDSSAVIDIPATALTTTNQQPAVWIVDPSTSTVKLRPIDVLRYDPGAVVVSQGLEPGDVVVTAGVQALYPGQKVRLLGSTS